MTSPAFLVDTNILHRPSLYTPLTTRIREGTLRVYVPTLIHAERIRQLADKRGEDFAIHIIQQFVEASGFELLPFSVADAEAVASVWLKLKTQGLDDKYWRSHRLDILLCAVAKSRDYTLITDDTGRHFEVVASRMNTTELQNWLERNSE